MEIIKSAKVDIDIIFHKFTFSDNEPYNIQKLAARKKLMEEFDEWLEERKYLVNVLSLKFEKYYDYSQPAVELTIIYQKITSAQNKNDFNRFENMDLD